MKRWLLTLAFLPFLAALPTAAVESFNPVAGNLGFNVMTEGNASLVATESEGPIAVGGNLIVGGGYNVSLHDAGTFTVGSDARPSSLVVGGRVDWASGAPSGLVRVLAGYVKIGDLAGSEVHALDGNGAQVNTRVTETGADYGASPRIELAVQQPKDTVGAAGLIDFTAAFGTFRERSATLAACPNDVALLDSSGVPLIDGQIPANGQVRIQLVAGRQNILNISSDELSKITEMTFVDPLPAKDTPFVVNVSTGDTFDWHSPNMAGVSIIQAPYILWNLPTVTQLVRTGGDTLEGTLYAPNATFVDNGNTNVEGDIIVKTLKQNVPRGIAHPDSAEYHTAHFDATLRTCETPTPTPTVIPVPTLTPIIPTPTLTPIIPVPTPIIPTPTLIPIIPTLTPIPTSTPTLTPVPTETPVPVPTHPTESPTTGPTFTPPPDSNLEPSSGPGPIPTSPSSPALPSTGFDPRPLAMTALAAIGAGIWLLRLGSARRNRQPEVGYGRNRR